MIKIDTKKVNESGHDLMLLSDELGQLIDELFLRLTCMNTKTFEWVGKAADEYIRNLKNEKTEYVIFKNELHDFGKYLTVVANTYESKIESCRYDKK